VSPVHRNLKHTHIHREHTSELIDEHNTEYELCNYLFPELHSFGENIISKSVNKMREQIQSIVGQTARHWFYFTLLTHSLASCILSCVTLWLRINANSLMKQHNNPFIYQPERQYLIFRCDVGTNRN
jgi:hypothetical protein